MIMKKHILFFFLSVLPMVIRADSEGTCGPNLNWTYVVATKTLTISGSGNMKNYYIDRYSNTANTPWSNFRSDILTVVIESGVTSIGEYAFWSCYNLISVIIGSNVTSIGDNAFTKTNIKKAIWLTNTPPSGYLNVNSAVNYVSNEHFAISNTIVYPFLSSFFETNGIRYVPVSPSERTCDAIDCVYNETAVNTYIPSTVIYQGIAMSVKNVQQYMCCNNKHIECLNCDNEGEIAQYAFYGCSNMKSAILGDKISSIEDYAFLFCSSLQSIDIPDAVTKLGQGSFLGCESMTGATIGSKVEHIDEYSFQVCSSLVDLVIGENVSTIGDCSFGGCTSLSLIKIPKSVKTIYNTAFAGCTELKTVIIEDRKEDLYLDCHNDKIDYSLFSSCPLDSVYIGGGNFNYYIDGYITYYGYSPFYRNTSLRTVVIASNRTEISANEFYGCSNLQNFIVGDGVKKIGDWAFSSCSSLKSLVFGSQLQTIGKEAFSDCTAVTKIVSKTATPPTCGNQALNDINKWTCTLVVPKGCATAYQAADQWKEFFFIEEGEGGSIDPVNPEAKKCAKPVIYYSNGKLTFESATDGAVCESTITDTDITSFSGNEVQLGITYHISVYATKPGLENSETATATLCWIDVEPQKEGITGDEDAVTEMKAMPVLIQNNDNTLTINGAPAGIPIHVYDLSGRLIGNATAVEGTTRVQTVINDNVIIVRVGERSIKVAMK